MLKPVMQILEVSLWIKGLHEKWRYYGSILAIQRCMMLCLSWHGKHHGVDSMANTMVWVLALLLNNPEMLAKAQIELDTNVGKDRLVEESDIPNLKYLQALLKETLRMYPVGPLLVPHETMEDCHVAGYFVPRGTGLFINAWTIQRDANVRAEPIDLGRAISNHQCVHGRKGP
ncbi:hypothetical protein Scep_003691 [Stephania cephalantha]|uniref:Cytochrome P450 n=1 Tax=Stephania cephalantha TaxID=152367 RepID=A0AAP0PUM6_9MAGN